MKKEAKVEFGIVITKPWSSEMYAHNELVADVVREEVARRLAEEVAKEVSFYDNEEEALEQEWTQVNEPLREIQIAITCYGFGYGYNVGAVLERIEQELEDAPTYRLKEIAEDLEIELEKGFVGFS